MAGPEFDVNYVARLARLALTDEEAQRFGAQLSQVLHHIDTLRQVDVSGVEPMAHPFPQINVTRPDEVRPSLPHDLAVRNAPATLNGLFLVPKIVE